MSTDPRREFKDCFRDLLDRQGRGGRDPDEREQRELRAYWEAWVRQYDAGPQAGTVGDMSYVLERPPSWARVERQLGLETVQPETLPSLTESSEPGQRPQHGGRPLKPVMSVEDARQLQAVIDVAVKNGSELVVDRLAKRFVVSRGRIRQAIALRGTGYDLSESPSEFRTVSDRDGMVRWPTLERPSKS